MFNVFAIFFALPSMVQTFQNPMFIKTLSYRASKEDLILSSKQLLGIIRQCSINTLHKVHTLTYEIKTLMLDVLPNTKVFTIQGTGYIYLRHHLTIGNSINDVAQHATVESINKGIIIYQ